MINLKKNTWIVNIATEVMKFLFNLVSIHVISINVRKQNKVSIRSYCSAPTQQVSTNEFLLTERIFSSREIIISDQILQHCHW